LSEEKSGLNTTLNTSLEEMNGQLREKELVVRERMKEIG